MPSYKNLVALLSSPSPIEPADTLPTVKHLVKGMSEENKRHFPPLQVVDTLTTVKQLVEAMSEEKKLEVVQEPGLLKALNKLLAGDAALAALKVLCSLTKGLTPTNRMCKAAVFLVCLPSIKDQAATGSTLERKQWAWVTLTRMANMKEEHLKAMFDSPDMVALLQSGMKSTDADIAESATITLSNLCCDEETASAVLDNHPNLVQTLVDTFSNVGVCEKFERKSS